MTVERERDVNSLEESLGGVNDIKTTLLSRNITVNSRRTSVRLEPEMWSSLYDIAKRESCSIHDICTLISMRKNEKTSLTAAIRVFLMLYFRASSTEEGHKRAGHGNFEFMKSRAGLNDATIRKPMTSAQVTTDGGANRYIRQG